MVVNLRKNLIIFILTFFIIACGGSGADLNNRLDNLSISLSFSQGAIINLNQENTIDWNVQGDIKNTNCTASDDWSGEKGISGSETIPTQSFGQYTFTLTCQDLETNLTKSVDLFISGLSEQTEFVEPESVGLNSQKLSNAFDYAMRDGNYTQSVFLVKDGKYIDHKYRGILPSESSAISTSLLDIRSDDYLTRDSFSLVSSWSTGKSFTSILIGIAIDNGFIESIDESASVYIDEWANDERQKVTIRHLLDMRSGLVPMCGESGKTELFICNERLSNGGAFVFTDNQMDKCIDRPLAQVGASYPWFYADVYPENAWLYSNCDTNVLGEIIFRATGKDLQIFADEVLFSKLNIDAYWWRDNANGGQADGNYLAYCCLDATPRDFIKFGQLILNNGIWSDERIVSEAYISTIKDIIVTSQIGQISYGLKFWTISPGSMPDESVYPQQNTLYATQGFDGQYIVIDFENNMIIGRNSLYYPMLDLSSERKMKISFEGSNYTATLPAGVGLFDNSNFWHQYYLYLINQAIE